MAARIDETPTGLRVSVPFGRSRDVVRGALFLLGVFGFFTGLGLVLAFSPPDPKHPNDNPWVGVVFFGALFVLSGYYVWWRLFGREVAILDGKELIAGYVVGPLRATRRFPLACLGLPRVVTVGAAQLQDKKNAAPGKLGRVVLERTDGGEPVALFATVDDADAKQIADKLRAFLQASAKVAA